MNVKALPLVSNPTKRSAAPVEWPTLALVGAVYAMWGLSVFAVAPLSVPLAILLLIPAIALFSSLQHEVVHGHPFKDARLNAALVWPSLALVIPYGRFRDLHLMHHRDCRLTDPYDDPESNFFDGGELERAPRWLRAVLAFNNTLAGRILIGPVVGQVAFMAWDLRTLRSGDRAVARAWLAHLPAVATVLWVVSLSPLPLWAYLLSAYGGLSILKIRTFLEHQAHEQTAARSVIIEDRGPLSFLFLNNNLHVVHHMHPDVPWYRLPVLFARDRGRYLGRNGGYRYGSYTEIFGRYLLRAKDPVAHPLWRR